MNAKVFFLTMAIVYEFSSVTYSQESTAKEGSSKSVKSLIDIKSKKYTEEDLLNLINRVIEKKILDLKEDELSKYPLELLKRDNALDLREKSLEMKEQQLNKFEQDFGNRLDTFDKKQQEFLGCLSQNDQKKNERINHVVSVISNMKPEKAAQLLSVQDPEISVRVLELLEAKKASRIFNLMDEAISARIQKEYMNMKK